MKIALWNTDLKEAELGAIVTSFENRQIGMGDITKELEKELAAALNVPYAVVFPSGSVALYVALKINNIGPGDEVIVPDRTFIATAHAVLLAGAKVKLVDVDGKTSNIDISKIEDAISKKTKAIMPVHLNGRAVDMKQINKIADKYALVVIEDACQSIFSKNKEGEFLGTLSDVGSYSLGMAKLLSMGYGGFNVCHNKDDYEKMIALRNHGSSAFYKHEGFGFNFKVSDLLSALCRVQLSRREEKIVNVTKIYNRYKEALAKLDFIDLIEVDADHGEIPLYVEVKSKERESLIEYLNSHDIETQMLPPSLHQHEHLNQEGSFAKSLVFENESFKLPCGPDQDMNNVEYVIAILQNYKSKQL